MQLIPNFVGRSFDEIRTSELYALYRFVPTEEYSSEYAEGVIMSQTPAANSVQTEETPVIEITVSLGPNLVEMPDIIGWPQENAQAMLDSCGISYRMMVRENDGSYVPNCVVECSEAPGSSFNAQEIILDVWIAGDVASSDSSSTSSAG